VNEHFADSAYVASKSEDSEEDVDSRTANFCVLLHGALKVFLKNIFFISLEILGNVLSVMKNCFCRWTTVVHYVK
jgi:hypothetical protein